ncbi:MAG TPA: HAD-IA family hydrolase [Oligoflexia bacterium]|nr:HAD-IA family hydrolase [Oligoflexia bacterium]HMP49257.1 HAD-IA family hydrolase [Oligoflexia bacterium]
MIDLGVNTEGLIFDCDGTLVDTLEAHYLAWDNVFNKNGITVPENYLDQFNSCPSRMIIEKINSDFDTNFDPDKLAFEKEEYLNSNMGNVRPIEPVISYVKDYYGKVPMSVISGGVRKNVTKCLETLDILRYFDILICADDDHPYKTEPESFLRLARMMEVKPECCVVFEDGDVGIKSARLAGMRVVDVRTDLGRS